MDAVRVEMDQVLQELNVYKLQKEEYEHKCECLVSSVSMLSFTTHTTVSLF
jgi:hypothetical protein